MMNKNFYSISSDAYEAWKDNLVTKRFLIEINQLLLDAIEDKSCAHRDSIERIAIEAIKNAKYCETLEEVLKWKPQELQKDKD